MTLFSGKISIFTPRTSDDRFLVINVEMFNVVYYPFFTRKTTISKKNSLITPFCTLLTTLLLKILGGTDAWAVPQPQTLGDRPPSPSRSPPLIIVHQHRLI